MVVICQGPAFLVPCQLQNLILLDKSYIHFIARARTKFHHPSTTRELEERNSNILGKVMKPVELPERAEECQNITASSNLLGLVINHRVFYHKKWITLIISILFLFFKNNRTNLNTPPKKKKKKKPLAKNTNISFT